ncbi:TonB-dependent receptor [Olivibacter sp. SDN3]|uniref:TonB-dependent receptor n=1 Tax=Olivibacter sp. SDN3 TaxID=2764720 RepID=UPI0016515C21|nr:TonB-dependent receptor [Olivibacter sp. SDN3]QNL49467.1 TonB-dependent receptor [Olivibacter sp. SDN3]
MKKTIKTTTFLLLFLLSGSFLAFGQQRGTIKGTVTDASMGNETMPSVSVVVEGTKQGVNTDVQGGYSLSLTPGTHILVFSYIGYQTHKDTVSIRANETLTHDLAMQATANMLDDVVITEEVRRDTESALLRQQMTSAVITQSIGAQEMGRKGISNAEVALTKVTGIAKQEGTSGIFVRGLGDRYNSTFLNGLPLPSNEPTSKNVALNLFGTDVIQSVAISKIYTADTYGDVGGASVNIISKEHTGRPNLEVNVGTGINTQAFGADFKQAANLQKSGFYNIYKPTTIREYQFDSPWSPVVNQRPYNLNFGVTGGNSWNVGRAGSLSLFATVAYENDFTYRKGSERIIGNRQDIVIADYFNVDKYVYTSHTTGMLNVKYRLNERHSLKYNTVFINGSSSSVNEYNVILPPERNQERFMRQTLTLQNQLWLNQLLGEHQLRERLSLDWGASYSLVNADMPDRITNNLILGNNDNYIYNTAAAYSQNRYFQYIDEKEWAGRAALKYQLFPDGANGYKGNLTIGYTGKMKKRNFDANQYNIRILGNVAADKDNIDAFINPTNLDPPESTGSGRFSILTQRNNTNLTPFTYAIDQNIHGGYANFEQHIGSRLNYTLGFRADKVLQKMTWNTNIQLPNLNFRDADIDKLFFLPEATLKYSLTESQNLRFAASKSYTLPQFLEKAPFEYEDVVFISRGNAAVYPSDNYNLDIKWEKFPSRNELLSFGVFGKYIANPISQALINAASPNTFSFVNAGDFAYVVGAELDVRKDFNEYFSGGVNVTYMYTRQELDPQKVTAETEQSIAVNFNTDRDGLQGASPLLVNADLTYKFQGRAFSPTVSIIGNYFYDRIFSLGSFGRGNIVERGYPIIGLVANTDIGRHWQLGLKVNNLTDSRIRMEQQNEDADEEVYSYRRGLDFSLGLKYKIF